MRLAESADRPNPLMAFTDFVRPLADHGGGGLDSDTNQGTAGMGRR
jgi:hypothetical protein